MVLMSGEELKEFEMNLDSLSKEELFLMFKDSLYHTYKMALKRDNLQQKIDKAIEYLKNNINYTYIDLAIDGVVEDLLEILGDEENE